MPRHFTYVSSLRSSDNVFVSQSVVTCVSLTARLPLLLLSEMDLADLGKRLNKLVDFLGKFCYVAAFVSFAC